MTAPSITVVVPYHDNPEKLAACLERLAASTASFELVLVDDASTGPAAPSVARAHEGARHVRLERNSGPGVARNEGVAVATGDVVMFVDADVLVEPTTVEAMADLFAREPTVDAAFGSYDDAPADPGLVSTYRNLLHHYVHHGGAGEASTFWAGCGAVRREAFVAVGGFDPAYRYPSIEDIELGMRLKAAGHTIRLDPAIQCKHLKAWRLREMVFTDVVRRAVPWTRLLLERPGIADQDLNLQTDQKVSVALVYLALAAALVAAVFVDGSVGAFYVLGVPAIAGVAALARRLERTLDATVTWASVGVWLALLVHLVRAHGLAAAAPALLLGVVGVLNARLYRFFHARGGPGFAVASTVLHWFYFLYGGAAFLFVHAERRLRRTAPDAG